MKMSVDEVERCTEVLLPRLTRHAARPARAASDSVVALARGD